MSNFKPGQKVVCVADGWSSPDNNPVSGPAKDEICAILQLTPSGFLVLAGYEASFLSDKGPMIDSYHPKWFRPLETHSASVSISVLESLPLTVKETIDTPQKQEICQQEKK